MKACEKCGTIVGEDARVCGSCSSEALVLVKSEPLATVVTGKRTCPRCEIETEAGAKYCKNCQLPFERGAAFGRMSILGGGGTSDETSMKKSFAVAVAVVVAATIVVALTIVWMGWNENSPRGVIKQAFDQIEDNDSDALIKLQARKMREAILSEGEPVEYAERVAQASSELRRLGGVKAIEVVEEKLNNERATVVYTVNYGNGEKKSARAKLLLENGKWKLAYWPVVAPATVAREVLTAMGRGDGEAVRKLLCADILSYQISLHGSKQGARDSLINKYIRVGDVFESNGGITAIEIKSEQETDEEATVDYILRLGNGITRERQMWMVKEKGLWKISLIPDHSLTDAPPVFSAPF